MVASFNDIQGGPHADFYDVAQLDRPGNPRSQGFAEALRSCARARQKGGLFEPRSFASESPLRTRAPLSVPKTPSIGFSIASESEHDCWMFAIAFLFVRVLCDCFKSRRRLEAEILVLRHQLNVLQQRAPRRLYLTWADRALFVRLEPRALGWR